MSAGSGLLVSLVLHFWEPFGVPDLQPAMSCSKCGGGLIELVQAVSELPPETQQAELGGQLGRLLGTRLRGGR